ncbi:MAG: 3-phosphoshikimate 1-carboxyvinyltransferase, partial [Anaerolineales bacterium]|nr:3-phosphoshikimate 1-carboxyvinyltransferase [Anaerolineales bacterium]
MQITPIPHPLSATVRVPGSKSLTNRALLIASLANGATRLTNALFSDDSLYFAKALQTLGIDVQLDEANHEMTVTGLGGIIPANKAELFIGNSGTSARFLSAFLTLGHGEYILDGDARMKERPIGDLISALRPLGAKLGPAHTDDWSLVTDYSRLCPPVKIIASGLPGGKTQIAGNISSQFLSALLMVAPYAKSPIEIEVTAELNSKPYVDMTIAIMQDFGVKVERDEYQSFRIPTTNYVIPKRSGADQLPTLNPSARFASGRRLQSPISTYPIESDASAASYLFAAPAICGGTVRVENISRNSKQGDIAFLDVLQKMGCQVMEGENFIEVSWFGSGDPNQTNPVKRWSPDQRLQGVDVDMRDIPDTAQTLAAIAPFASSSTRIRGIASARVKETDRVHATCTELARLGVRVEEHEDGMT